MDDIVMCCAKKHLSDAKNVDFVESQVIEKTHSFQYETHFRAMLMRVVGLVKVEELERSLDPTKFHLMKSSLGTLKTQRDKEAHTYIAGTTPTLNAPSVIIAHFHKVYEALKDVEKCIGRLKF